jgi:hypothetical protein
MIKRTVYTLCVTVLVLACKIYRIWGSMFLNPEDLEGEQPITPSGQHRAWLGLSTSRTSEEIQWDSNDLGVVRVCYGTPSVSLLLLLLLLRSESKVTVHYRSAQVHSESPCTLIQIGLRTSHYHTTECVAILSLVVELHSGFRPILYYNKTEAAYVRHLLYRNSNRY